ncbi:3-oxo-5-alpha-steroid 4-dehydrogenase 1 [Lamellibrachia satsuma]|nr:3-oxo-5-alpha-steroid 4-dehydrogenase 1 [Lamellibrachia satsuma]
MLAGYYSRTSRITNVANALLLGMFSVHYLHRTFIYPLLIRGGTPTPLLIFLISFSFCSLNGYLQGCSLIFCGHYPPSWTTDPRFYLGIFLFFAGMAINIHSDHILRTLRKPGETRYHIPTGGMFNHISGANYFGEIVEWCGFALACWSVSASSMALFTVANLAPRAFAHHRWYKEKFAEDYPKNRSALIPFLW